VGIVGIGGLGHLALQWTVALGAEAYALTHSPSKKDDCKKLGAKDVILTTDEKWLESWKAKFDCIMNCADVTDKFDMASYLSLLKPGREFHMVGIPDKPLPEMSAGIFAGGAPKLTGSHLGNHQEMEALLKLAAEKNVKPWVEVLDI
jgi:alcohol dehydrogenase (NADP+)